MNALKVAIITRWEGGRERNSRLVHVKEYISLVNSRCKFIKLGYSLSPGSP